MYKPVVDGSCIHFLCLIFSAIKCNRNENLNNTFL